MSADMLSERIGEYFRTLDSIQTKAKELKLIGDKSAITKSLQDIEESIKKIREESSFTAEEETKYGQFTALLQGMQQESVERAKELTVLGELKLRLSEYFENIETNLKTVVLDRVLNTDLSIADKTRRDITTLFEAIMREMQFAANSSIEKHFKRIGELETVQKELGNKIELSTTEIGPLVEKMKSQDRYILQDRQRQEETAKLTRIEEKEKEISTLENQLAANDFFAHYEDIFSSYKRIVQECKKYSNIPDADNLKLTSSVKFDRIRFKESFSDKVDKRSTLAAQVGNFFDDKDMLNFNEDTHLESVKAMLQALLPGRVKTRAGVEISDLVKGLLSNCFVVDHNLVQDNEDLLKMSPGKRGIILFQLFLHLSKSTDPILIDQPEDNLDNRTVYQELNDFIKAKKTKRQIIIVSHNPNLVVSTDSENVIVANQEGQNRSARNSSNKFEYVSGGLENSFKDEKQKGILFQEGIREHVCEILEGGEEAFEKRESKYGMSRRRT